jgi:hypothetical protein
MLPVDVRDLNHFWFFAIFHVHFCHPISINEVEHLLATQRANPRLRRRCATFPLRNLAMTTENAVSDSVPTNQVLHDELGFIDLRRQKVLTDGTVGALDPTPPRVTPVPADETLREAALDKALVGLAFSGGGVRSATFNLGVLQALADFGLLKYFDYLSTVSGGGYIGGWLAAWIKRDGDLGNVEKQLKLTRADQSWARRQELRAMGDKIEAKPLDLGEPRQEEPEPIYHLRAYSSYLAPWLGFFSADVWVLIATYLRNFLLNQAVLLPAVLFVLFAVRLVYWAYFPGHSAWWSPVLAMAGVVVCWLLAFGWVIYSLGRLREFNQPRGARKKHLQLGPNMLHLLVLLPMLIASVLTCRRFVPQQTDPGQAENSVLFFWSDFGDVFDRLGQVVGKLTSSEFATDPRWRLATALAAALVIAAFFWGTAPVAAPRRIWYRRCGGLLLAVGLAAFLLWCPLVPDRDYVWSHSLASGVLTGGVFGVTALSLSGLAFTRFVWRGRPWSRTITAWSVVGTAAGFAVSFLIGLAGGLIVSLPVFLLGQWLDHEETYWPLVAVLLGGLWFGLVLAALHILSYLLHLLVTANKSDGANVGGEAPPPVLLQPSRPGRLAEIVACWEWGRLAAYVTLGLLTGFGIMVLAVLLLIASWAPFSSDWLSEMSDPGVFDWKLAYIFALIGGFLHGGAYVYFLLIIFVRHCRKCWKTRFQGMGSGGSSTSPLWKDLGLEGTFWWLLATGAIGLSLGMVLWAVLTHTTPVHITGALEELIEPLIVASLLAGPALLLGSAVLWWNATGCVKCHGGWPPASWPACLAASCCTSWDTGFRRMPW